MRSGRIARTDYGCRSSASIAFPKRDRLDGLEHAMPTATDHQSLPAAPAIATPRPGSFDGWLAGALLWHG